MPRKKTTKRKGSQGWIAPSKLRPLLVVLIFGLVGAGYLLYQTFAATEQIKYWGALTSKSPTASYRLTTGSGAMNVTFTNNTADVTLTVTNSAKKVIGSLKSMGRREVRLAVDVTPDTYTIDLKATKSFTANKGYKIMVSYPTGDLNSGTKPTAVITKPLASETVTGIVDFSALAQDPTGITKVEFYANSVLIGTDNTSPYAVKWDTTSLKEGAHQLAVKSYNKAGLIGDASGVANVKKATAPTTPTTPTNPTPAANEKFGMSAPADKWSQRLAEVGGPAHINYRRIFMTSLSGSMNKVEEAIKAGMVPIISYKVNPYSWAQVASGSADSELRSIVTKLNAIPGEKFVALHHEPNGDGTAKDWADMQIHALPILKTGKDVKVGVIGNGWWWSNRAQGLSDAELAQWIPAKVIEIADVIASDTYQDANLNESGGPKAKNMAAWGKRVGVKGLGIGEFNGLNAAGITEAMNAVKAEPLFKWACVWNSDTSSGNLGVPLEGARLEAFKKGLSTPNQT